MKDYLSPATLESAENAERRNIKTFPGILAKQKFPEIFDPALMSGKNNKYRSCRAYMTHRTYYYFDSAEGGSKCGLIPAGSGIRPLSFVPLCVLCDLERSGRETGLSSLYPTAWPNLNIGRYMAMMSPPRTTPRKTIIMGSIMAVRLVTMVSTSSS